MFREAQNDNPDFLDFIAETVTTSRTKLKENVKIDTNADGRRENWRAVCPGIINEVVNLPVDLDAKLHIAGRVAFVARWAAEAGGEPTRSEVIPRIYLIRIQAEERNYKNGISQKKPGSQAANRPASRL